MNDGQLTVGHEEQVTCISKVKFGILDKKISD